jgi:hypothetical protein
VANENLGNARKAKNDEFYTQYRDIEKEMNAYLEYNPDVFRGKTILLPCDDPEWSNFTKFFAQKFQDLGLKKLISTSYAPDSKPEEIPYQPTLFEIQDEKFDEKKTQSNGKIFILTRDKTGDGVVNVDDLEWSYLEGDGDFRSDEIRKLRDEADIIITNPPFSLFREFWDWLIESNKRFVVLGNMNAITYREIFPFIMRNLAWTGTKSFGGGMNMIMPSGTFDSERAGSFTVDEDGKFIKNIMGVIWFTNIDHGRRHEPLALMTEQDNIKFSKHKEVRGVGYQKYDNYDAIEVPFTDAIPSDFRGVMGVPITFLDKYNPDQFEILGITDRGNNPYKTKNYSTLEVPNAGDLNRRAAVLKGGVLTSVYARLLVRHRKSGGETSG